MDQPLVHSKEKAIIALLQNGPQTVTELQPPVGIHVQSLRSLLKRMENEQTVVRHGYKNGSVLYLIRPHLKRRQPRIKQINAETGVYNYRSLSDYLAFLGVDSKAQKAARYLPVLATKLLMLGLKYNTITEEARNSGTDTLDIEFIKSRSQPLLKDLRMVKVELKGHIDALNTYLLSLQQIYDNEAFWNASSLSDHFNLQFDSEQNLIPPVGLQEVIDAHNLIQED